MFNLRHLFSKKENKKEEVNEFYLQHARERLNKALAYYEELRKEAEKQASYSYTIYISVGLQRVQILRNLNVEDTRLILSNIMIESNNSVYLLPLRYDKPKYFGYIIINGIKFCYYVQKEKTE